jgi:hypothetical protein
MKSRVCILNSLTPSSTMKACSCLGASLVRNHHGRQYQSGSSSVPHQTDPLPIATQHSAGSVDHCEIPFSGTQVMLRHAGIDLYYACRKHWVGNPDSALDLETIERATELSREESFEEMDIVVTFGDPARELVLSLRRQC